MIYSPLRYPGGKRKLAPLMELIIEESGYRGCTYVEPFAGGAGIALELLGNGVVSDIVLNDSDIGIYSFWLAVLTETDRFIETIEKVPLSIEEWNRQRKICFNNANKYSFELGFSTFYLNRTNRSGIIKGGVMGGKEQSGESKLDARFNRDGLIKRIEKISEQKTHIQIYHDDIEIFIKEHSNEYINNTFMYFDPPYFEKGKELFVDFFNYDDHLRLKRAIKNNVKCDWIMTYDDTPEITEIYSDYYIKHFVINYSLAKKRKQSELIIFSDKSIIPDNEVISKSEIKIMIQ